MVGAGIPDRDPEHASEAVLMALNMITVSSTVKSPNPDIPLQVIVYLQIVNDNTLRLRFIIIMCG